MKRLHGRPLVPLAISLAVGIAVGSNHNVFTPRALAGLVCVTVLALIAVAGFARGFWRLATAAALLLIIGAFAESRLEFGEIQPGDIATYEGREPRDIEGVVVQAPQLREIGARLVVRLERIHLPAGAYVPVVGSMMVYVREGAGDVRYGDRVRFESPVRKVHPSGNPGSMRLDRTYREDGVSVTGYVRTFSAMRVVARRQGNPIRDVVEGIRRAIDARLTQSLETPHRELVAALILGESGQIPQTVRETYRDAGVAHILAVSGMNMTAAAGITFFLVFLALRTTPRLPLHIHAVKIAAAVSIVPVMVYAMLAGLSHSVMRAAIMAAMFLLAILFDRSRDLLTAIAFAAILILLWKPDALFNVGFQLSFGAVIAIVAVVPPAYSRWRERGEILDRKFPTRKRRVADVVGLSLISSAAALWATLPITAYHFNGFSTYSLFANLIVVPLFTLMIMPMAFASVAAMAIHPAIAHVFLIATGWAINAGSHIVRLFALLPGAYIRLPAPTMVETAAWYALILVPILRTKAARLILAGTIVFVLAGSGVAARLADRLDSDLRLRVIDVGQGLSQLLELPGGEKILIDGGGQGGPGFDVGERILAPYLWNRRIRRLDIVIASHPDADHYGGLEFVLRHFSVGELWIGDSDPDPAPEGWARMLAAAEENEIPIVRVSSDMAPLVWGDTTLAVLWPPHGDVNMEPDDNGRSLVVRVSRGSTALLLPADLPAEKEVALVTANRDLTSDVIVASHHGSADGSSESFLGAVRPSDVVISAGYANRFGHPAPETLRRLMNIDARIWRTDRDGLVTCRSDGVSVRCEGARPLTER